MDYFRTRNWTVQTSGSIRLHGLAGSGFTSRQIDGKLWEIKVSRHRVFYVLIEGPLLVLLHAYKKQGQKAPQMQIAVARSRMKEVLNG
jgi:phage-related protein